MVHRGRDHRLALFIENFEDKVEHIAERIAYRVFYESFENHVQANSVASSPPFADDVLHGCSAALVSPHQDLHQTQWPPPIGFWSFLSPSEAAAVETFMKSLVARRSCSACKFQDSCVNGGNGIDPVPPVPLPINPELQFVLVSDTDDDHDPKIDSETLDAAPTVSEIVPGGAGCDSVDLALALPLHVGPSVTVPSDTNIPALFDDGDWAPPVTSCPSTLSEFPELPPFPFPAHANPECSADEFAGADDENQIDNKNTNRLGKADGRETLDILHPISASEVSGWRPSLWRQPVLPPFDCKPNQLRESAPFSENAKFPPADSTPKETTYSTFVCSNDDDETCATGDSQSLLRSCHDDSIALCKAASHEHVTPRSKISEFSFPLNGSLARANSHHVDSDLFVKLDRLRSATPPEIPNIFDSPSGRETPKIWF